MIPMSRISPSKSLILALTFFAPFACQKRGAGGSQVSEIRIDELNVDGYDRFEVELKSTSQAENSLPTQKLARGTRSVDLKAIPGEYKFRLDYFLKDKLVFGADLCSAGQKNNTQTLVAGPNAVSLNICRADGDSVTPEPETSATFSLREGKLYRPGSTNPFYMRGINMPVAYYYKESLTALDRVKELGFNTVRMVWCASSEFADLNDRCNADHLKSAQELEAYLGKVKSLGLVAVFELQNLTGSNDIVAFERLVRYYLQPEIKAVLEKFQDIVLINIANEWHGEWEAFNPDRYMKGYRSVIKTLRKGVDGKGGLPHVLIADARGYGQRGSSIAQYMPELLAEDRAQFKENMFMMSSHMYDSYATRESVMEVFDAVRSQNWPFMVGEFACSHGKDENDVDADGDRDEIAPVACETIMSEANSSSQLKMNIIAWSYTGNFAKRDIDLVEQENWTCLTPFGKRVIKGMFGQKQLDTILAADRKKQPACN